MLNTNCVPSEGLVGPNERLKEQGRIHPIDPDDSHYVNLALHAEAGVIVSRDKHLLNLMDAARKEAQEFMAQFPAIRVIDPVELLQELEGPHVP